MMTCQDAAELLADLVEGTLGVQARAALERHMDICPPCERLMESYRKTTSLCREALRKEAPAELVDRLMMFLRTRCGRSGES